MRPITLFLIMWLLFPLMLPGQYFVIKVVDRVYVEDQLLKKRDKLSEEVQLRFSTPEAYVHILSPTKGQFVLSGEKARRNNRGEFFVALKQALIPYDQFLAAATRSTKEELVFEDKYDLKAFFRGNICLLDSLALRVVSEKHPTEGAAHFRLTHQLPWRKTSQPLHQESRQVIISPEVMQNKRGQNIQHRVKHSYLEYVQENGDIESFGPFHLTFLSQAAQFELKTDLAYIYELAEPKDQEAFIVQHALPFVSHYYGDVPLAQLRLLVEAF